MTELRSRATTTATDSNNDEPGHQPDETALSSDTVDHHSHDENTASHTSVQQATWRQQLWCCDIVIQENRLQSICDQFGLTRLPTINSMPENHQNNTLSHHIERLIAKECGKNTTVTIYTTNGDGNCLFRAISLGLTHSQEAHHLTRNNIIKNLLDTSQSQNTPIDVGK